MQFLLRTLASVSTFFCMGLMVAVPIYADLDPADIIAIWLFDEGDGDTVGDASHNPHGMHGTLEGGWRGADPGLKPTWVDGKFGNALKCEGTGSVISIPNFNKDERLGLHEDDVAAGKRPDETEITITAWVQRNDKIGTAAQTDLFSYEPGGPWDKRILVHFPWDDGEGEFVLWQYGKPPHRNLWEFPANGGEMNHYAFTGNGKETVIYQNGKAVNHGPGAEPFVRSAQHGPWHICGRFGSSAQVTVDDVGIFSRVLNNNEIVSIMQEGLDEVVAALDIESTGKLSTTWGEIKTGN